MTPRPATCRRFGAAVSGTIHELVTARMIATLERGTISRRKPWHTRTGQARSMSTGQPYRAIRVFLLRLAAAEDGYTSPSWRTTGRSAAWICGSRPAAWCK
jgi:antirestriction protein ArdC